MEVALSFFINTWGGVYHKFNFNASHIILQKFLLDIVELQARFFDSSRMQTEAIASVAHWARFHRAAS